MPIATNVYVEMGPYKIPWRFDKGWENPREINTQISYRVQLQIQAMLFSLPILWMMKNKDVAQLLKSELYNEPTLLRLPA